MPESECNITLGTRLLEITDLKSARLSSGKVSVKITYPGSTAKISKFGDYLIIQ